MSFHLPRPTRGSSALCLLVTSLMCAACADTIEPPTSTAVQRRPNPSDASHRLGRPEHVRPGENLFAKVADGVPSSAGIYFDSTGTLVVRVRDPKDDAAALFQLKQLAAAELSLRPGGGRSITGFKIVRADYTYHQLSEWRDLAFDHVLGRLDGVRTLDLDEGRNRVTIALDASNFAQARVTAIRTLGELGVDTAALRVA